MNINELYLKTIFCCMSCDGDIATEEIAFLKEFVTKSSDLVNGLDVNSLLDDYVRQINEKGLRFLKQYLSDLSHYEKTFDQEQVIIRLVIETIAADNVIQYSEVSFFKKIRKCLDLSKDSIAELFNDFNFFEKFKEVELEDFFLEDNEEEEFEWNDYTFDTIKLNMEIPKE